MSRTLLDKLGQIVEGQCKEHPTSAISRLAQHRLRRGRAEMMSARDVAGELEHKAMAAYLNSSSSKAWVQISPEQALVLAGLIYRPKRLSRDDLEAMLRQGFPSAVQAAAAYGVDRKSIRRKLEEYGMENPWMKKR